MHNSPFTTIAALTTAALLTVAVANAATYKFSFQSSDAELTETGEITVDAAEQVTGVSGVISGLVDQTVYPVTHNPGFPSQASAAPTVCSSMTTCIIRPACPSMSTASCLSRRRTSVATGTSLATPPGNYSLYESGAGGYPVEESGTLSVTPVPELSTWAMLAMGFAGLGLVGHRRRAARLAPTRG